MVRATLTRSHGRTHSTRVATETAPASRRHSGRFENPKGVLSKPDFKRREQKRPFYDQNESAAGAPAGTGASYKARFFCLDRKGPTLSYYRNEVRRPKGAKRQLSVGSPAPPARYRRGRVPR